MEKLLIYWVLGASLILGGCARMNDLPIVFKPDIQQGNILDQEAVDKLEPGMSSTQVRYLMGTPMLVDVFHPERWDYVYSLKKGGDKPDMQRLTLYFEDNRLQRLEGDLRPSPSGEAVERNKDVVVRVPDNTGESKGFFTQALESFDWGSDRQE